MGSRIQFIIEEGAYALDGGSIFLSIKDNDGVQHKLILVQHCIPMDESDPRIPGRLYLDDQIVQIRSDEEIRLISELKKASISPDEPGLKETKEETGPVYVVSEDIADFLAATRSSPKDAIKYLVDSLVQFVESEEYLRLSAQFENDMNQSRT